jgi:hypothetical protein
LLGRCVALTLDDGSDFDFADLEHPVWGAQPSMRTLLERARTRGQPAAQATSFVVVSPDARAELERVCLGGARLWNHDWWPRAEASGLMPIESHSWDHNHEGIAQSVARAPRGTFRLRTGADADAEIARASDLLAKLRGRGGDVLFAYPYGQASEYLARDYLPRQAARHRVSAAFTTLPAPISRGANRWLLPRFVFRAHWRTPAQFEKLLDHCFGKAAGVPAVPKAVDTAGGFPFTLEETAQAGPEAERLFRRKFGAAPPDFPRHFVARSRGETPAVAAYIHFTAAAPGVYLVGGLCVDTRIYRTLTREERERVAAAGSLSRWVIERSTRALGARRAVYAFTGNTLSVRDALALGYEPAHGKHLYVQWHGEPAAGRAALTERIAQLGPF